MEITVYITVNALLFSSWYIFLSANKNTLSFSDRVLGAFVSGLTQIVLTEMVLGVLFKKLYPMPLFLFNTSISLAVLIYSLLYRKLNGKADVCGFLADTVQEVTDKTKHFLNVLKSDWIILTVSALFFINFCYLLFIGYLFPSYTWDSLFYHLPTVGFILQSGAIEQIPYNSLIYTFINIFPKNIDLFFLWNIIFLKSDVIVDLSQLFFTLTGMLSVYSIAVKLRIKEKYAVYSCFLFFFAPVIILQSTSNYVDIAVSALFLTAINFILCPRYLLLQESSGGGEFTNRGILENLHCLHSGKSGILLAGLTAGILFGSKGSGPLFVFVLSMFFIINELRTRFSLKCGDTSKAAIEHVRIKKIIADYFVCFLIPVIILGSYWYICNWVYYNNPVYPFRVSVFGKTIFPGIFSEMIAPIPDAIQNLSAIGSLFYTWMEKVEYYSYASDLSGFGPLWFILFLPAIVFSFLYGIRIKRYDFLLISGIIIFTFLVHPNNWNTRYVIFIFGLGCLSFGVLLDYFEEREKIVRFFALVFVLYGLLVSNSMSVTPGKIKEFVNLPVKARTVAGMEPYILNMTQRENYGLWAWIADNVSEDETLVYTFTPTLIGPLWNRNFSNKVLYIKAGKFEDWLEKLESNNATYILVLLRPRSMEALWLSRLGELRHIPKWSVAYKRFSLQYSDSDYAVMRFR